jgi:putative endonuclease
MQRRHEYFVYILTNPGRTVLYTGMTNSLDRRMLEHLSGEGSKFCKRYNVTRLVYYEQYQYVNDAIAREKQIKAGSRQSKLDLINELNPGWEDLAANLDES